MDDRNKVANIFHKTYWFQSANQFGLSCCRYAEIQTSCKKQSNPNYFRYGWDYYKLGNEKCLSFFGFQLSIRVVSWHKVDYQIEGNVRKTFLTMLLWLSKEIFNFPFCENKKVLRSFVENISFKISFYLHTSKLKTILDNFKN